MFTNRLRYFAKHVINPLISRNAGSEHSQFALIRHTGRKSGKQYETPLIVVPRGDDFVIALTYGAKVDWYRNLQAAGQATLLWHGKTYTIKKPEFIDRSVGLAMFSSFQQFILRRLVIQNFVRVTSAASLPV